MAKILFGGGVAEMRGSQAGSTFSRNRGGSYTRQRVTPLNPNSARQQSVRNNLTDIVTAWSNVLSQAQRDAWIAFAQAWPVTDVFGAAIVLTGLQYFSRCNMALMQAGQAMVLDAPLDTNVESLLSLQATVTATGSVFTVAFTPDPLSLGMALQVFATPALSPGVSFVKNRLRLISTLEDETASPANVSAAWQAVFGTFPSAGQKVVVEGRVVNLSTGIVSSSLQSAVIVGA